MTRTWHLYSEPPTPFTLSMKGDGMAQGLSKRSVITQARWHNPDRKGLHVWAVCYEVSDTREHTAVVHIEEMAL